MATRTRRGVKKADKVSGINAPLTQSEVTAPAETAKPLPPVTLDDLKVAGIEFLVSLIEAFASTPARNEAIAKAEDKGQALRSLLERLQVPSVAPPPRVDPLTLPHEDLLRKITKETAGPDLTVYYFGIIDGERASIHVMRIERNERLQVRLRWGCRNIYSERQARDHWRNNVSTKSSMPRPHASQLIDLIRDACAFHGWEWDRKA